MKKNFRLFIYHKLLMNFGRVFYQVFVKIVKFTLETKLFPKKYKHYFLYDIAQEDSFLVAVTPEKFVIPVSDTAIGRITYRENNPFELKKLEIINQLLEKQCKQHKKKFFIDIGANIGTVCIPAVGRGYFEKAIAIEPEPNNYALLSANVTLNKLSGSITTINSALGSQDNEICEFELSKDMHGDHRVRVANAKERVVQSLHDEESREIIKVQSNTLNSIIPNTHKDEHFIWVDAQGYEGHILSGSSFALDNLVPICMEFWPYGLKRGDCYDLLMKTLEKSNYKIMVDLREPSEIINFSIQALNDLKVDDSTDIFIM